MEIRDQIQKKKVGGANDMDVTELVLPSSTDSPGSYNKTAVDELHQNKWVTNGKNKTKSLLTTTGADRMALQ